MNILDQLAVHTKERVALAKQKINEKSLALLAMQQKKETLLLKKL